MKIRCDNCPARNSKVKNYIVFDKQLKLCEACAKIAINLKAKE